MCLYLPDKRQPEEAAQRNAPDEHCSHRPGCGRSTEVKCAPRHSANLGDTACAKQHDRCGQANEHATQQPCEGLRLRKCC